MYKELHALQRTMWQTPDSHFCQTQT